jgi:hypothetical protein
MPPKGKGKKGKTGDDDEYWYAAPTGNLTRSAVLTTSWKSSRDKVGESATTSAAVTSSIAENDDSKPARKSAFAGLSFSAEFEGGGGDGDDDGDSLMVCQPPIVLLLP